MGALLLVCALGVASPAAADPELSLEQAEYEVKRLNFRFALKGFFDEELQASLESGLPATLLLRWSLYEKREAWWDRDLVDGHLNFRIYYDLLEASYELFDGRGRSVARCADLARLELELETWRPLAVVLPGSLDPEHNYRLDLEARLEPLPAEEIRDLERWLRGEDSGGRGLLGEINRDAGKLMRRMQGLGERRAAARLELRPVAP
jgi:hypothetical protein